MGPDLEIESLKICLVKIKSYWNRVGPLLQYVSRPYKKMNRQRHGEDSHVKTEAEMGAMLPQAKEHLGLPETGRYQEEALL